MPVYQMSDLPYFKFMVDDWLGGLICTHSFEVQGLFVTLCARLWKAGGYLPDDEGQLARILRCDKQLLSKCLILLKQDKIICLSNDGNIYVKFIRAQLEARADLSVKRSRAGRKGGKAKAKHLLSNCHQPEPESEPESEERPPPAPAPAHTREDAPSRTAARLPMSLYELAAAKWDQTFRKGLRSVDKSGDYREWIARHIHTADDIAAWESMLAKCALDDEWSAPLPKIRRLWKQSHPQPTPEAQPAAPAVCADCGATPGADVRLFRCETCERRICEACADAGGGRCGACREANAEHHARPEAKRKDVA